MATAAPQGPAQPREAQHGAGQVVTRPYGAPAPPTEPELPASSSARPDTAGPPAAGAGAGAAGAAGASPAPSEAAAGDPSAIASVVNGVKWIGWKLFDAAEFTGEVLVEFLGLNQSKYQYVIDAYERHQGELREQSRRDAKAKAQLRELEDRAIDALEGQQVAAEAPAAAAAAAAISHAEPHGPDAGAGSAAGSASGPTRVPSGGAPSPSPRVVVDQRGSADHGGQPEAQ